MKKKLSFLLLSILVLWQYGYAMEEELRPPVLARHQLEEEEMPSLIKAWQQPEEEEKDSVTNKLLIVINQQALWEEKLRLEIDDVVTSIGELSDEANEEILGFGEDFEKKQNRQQELASAVHSLIKIFFKTLVQYKLLNKEIDHFISPSGAVKKIVEKLINHSLASNLYVLLTKIARCGRIDLFEQFINADFLFSDLLHKEHNEEECYWTLPPRFLSVMTEAVKNGHQELVEKFILHGIWGRSIHTSVLNYIVLGRTLALTNCLVEKKDRGPFFWANAFIVAARVPNLEILKLLYEKYCVHENKTTLNLMDNYKWTPLMYAAFDGNKESVQFLIDKTHNIDYMDQQGHTALTIALDYQQVDVMKLLIERGADLSICLPDQEPQKYIRLSRALSCALEADHKELLRALLIWAATEDVERDDIMDALLAGNQEWVSKLITAFQEIDNETPNT